MTFGRVDYTWFAEPDVDLADDEFWMIDEHVRNKVRYEIDTNNIPVESSISGAELGLTEDPEDDFTIYYNWGLAETTGVNSAETFNAQTGFIVENSWINYGKGKMWDDDRDKVRKMFLEGVKEAYPHISDDKITITLEMFDSGEWGGEARIDAPISEMNAESRCDSSFKADDDKFADIEKLLDSDEDVFLGTGDGFKPDHPNRDEIIAYLTQGGGGETPYRVCFTCSRVTPDWVTIDEGYECFPCAESFSAEESEGEMSMRRLDEMIDSMQAFAEKYLILHPVAGYSTRYPDMKVVLPSDEHEDYLEVDNGSVMNTTDAQELAANMVLRAMKMRDMLDDLAKETGLWGIEYDAESYTGAGSLMGISGDSDLSSFTSKELTESSAIHGDFDQASVNYSGHQNLEVRQSENDYFYKKYGGIYEDGRPCPVCALNNMAENACGTPGNDMCNDCCSKSGGCGHCMSE